MISTLLKCKKYYICVSLAQGDHKGKLVIVTHQTNMFMDKVGKSGRFIITKVALPGFQSVWL